MDLAIPGEAFKPLEDECTARCNGKWARRGMAEREFCICRTHDATKVCYDGLECEGLCHYKNFAAVEDPQTRDQCTPSRSRFCPRHRPVGRAVNVCAELLQSFGCAVSIPDGASKNGLVHKFEGLEHNCRD